MNRIHKIYDKLINAEVFDEERPNHIVDDGHINIDGSAFGFNSRRFPNLETYDPGTERVVIRQGFLKAFTRGSK